MNTPKDNACCAPGCCTPKVASPDAVREQVREGYGQIARQGAWREQPATIAPPSAQSASCGCSPAGGCCGPASLSPADLVRAIGYAQDDLHEASEGANLGLSCGNPTALAGLRAGEVVLDLGAGAGFDAFVAGPKVGASGRVIGVDMTPDMVSRARGLLPTYRGRSGLDNIEFRLGEIESLPVADASVDVVISNCVLNLSPDKPRVWREIARVLKPGGRVAVSDLALLRPLPRAVREDVEALVGCIAGAALVEDTRAQMAAAGLADIRLTPKPSYVEAMASSGDPLYRKIMGELPEGTTPADFITSLDIAARKPA